MDFQPIHEPDVVFWKLEKNNKFSVKSVYNGLTRTDVGPYHKRIWKGKISAKIKISMWLMTNDAILTKDNVIKRKWQGDPSCFFREDGENISHLFFQCPIAEVIWTVVAKCFGASVVVL